MIEHEIMGILNVTPDSFSDGGQWLKADSAVEHGRQMLSAGATIIDVGAESTRPGAQPVVEDKELARALPVIEALVAAVGGQATISIDTTKLAVAQAALDLGAGYVNDITAFRSAPELAGLVADHGARCCLMHMRGEPRTMQRQPVYENVVDDVARFLAERAEFAVAEGVPPECIDIDPGIGFGKTVEHNLELLSRLDRIAALGFRVVIGLSRKAFIGRLTTPPIDDPRARVAVTIASNVLAYERGARVFRVHDVAETVQALALTAATLRR